MNTTIVARWQDWSGDGIQHLVLNMRPDRIVAEGVVLATAEGSRFAAIYRIECDVMWQVRVTHARMVGVDRRIDLTGDGGGHWRDGSGASMSHLDGAVDVDLSVTPFTNTLAIRRLDLAQGHTADIRAVYVRLPDLSVTIDPQRYTCLKRGRLYRYESLDSDFVRDVEIDADGLVVTYPGLFRRVS
ncbi:MAG TPA: putative glycolipid-binding domain-containing protein [Vicinamibacterales bacterium]|nr:putative glycolipid-binding domain-containing protein [Vicinamibacterales bacterium]